MDVWFDSGSSDGVLGGLEAEAGSSLNYRLTSTSKAPTNTGAGSKTACSPRSPSRQRPYKRVLTHGFTSMRRAAR